MNNSNLSDIVKVTAAILVKDNKIIIAKRGPGDKLAHKWEFPGGKIETHETPEQCLKREMKEEFDIDVSVGEYLGSSIFYLNLAKVEEARDPRHHGRSRSRLLRALDNERDRVSSAFPKGLKLCCFFLETIFIQ